ncbi:MAG TPA: SAV_6107 family HEPN domain-containing protein [Ornithinimicrobium sp.]|uniref:SAV_6107 family HEPN domain-containing protein n=1 Tax=Ornithinimicrobium sp. TaxID=1977084 RepID=UPI002B463049|nr:SAV_6107 family HEPN domain-containing protein [Ornithinimicrobium sp.]HKJ12110.1 SAV_6107 family HEPN domain-containing protein [Ornithinimicrobium sp.]
MSNAGTVLDLLDRAREGLVQACHSDTSAERYTQSHLAALRAAAAVIAARSRPSRRSGPRSVWEVLPAVAPELTEWAVLYAASARRRGAVERGEASVSCREADDLVRASECFLEAVRGLLHLPVADPLPGDLAVISGR